MIDLQVSVFAKHQAVITPEFISVNNTKLTHNLPNKKQASQRNASGKKAFVDVCINSPMSFPRFPAHYTEAILFLSMKYVAVLGDKYQVSFGFSLRSSRREKRLKGRKASPRIRVTPTERAW